MNTKVRSVRNSGNLSKYQLFYYEPGCRVFIKVIHWLYKGQCPIEHLVVDLAKYKQIPVDENEKEKIFEELKKGINGLHNLTLPLLYKITQSVCGLANRNENVWTKKCPINKRDTLEYRLFKLIDDRSHVDHLDPTELKQLLKSILLAAGEKSKVDQQQIEDSVQKIENDIEQTCHENIIDVLFYDRCGSSVIIQIIHWLYEGKSPINDLVIDLIRYNEIKFDGTEKGAIEELERSNNSIGDLDITTLYKIIQTVCGLADRNDVVWTRNCPSGRQGELEHLLFKLKDGRNSVSHIAKKLKNISDSDVDQKSKEMEELLSLILKKAGEDMDVKEVDDAILFIQEDVEGIRKGSDDKIDATMKPHVLNIILNDLKSLYEEELKSSFQNELKGYSAPYLHVQESNKTIPLKDLLTFDESPVIIIQGEAGEGKSSLTRFVFYSWLAGSRNVAKNLTSFQVVLRVDCRHVRTAEESQVLRLLFPMASISFSDTATLKKHFSGFRVLWIFDGFHESTEECKSFLKRLTENFSERHKLLITARSSDYEELQECVTNLKTASLSLGWLQDENVEEIVSNLISADDKRDAFKAELNSLDDYAAFLLRSPLNLTLFVELWLEDPSQVRETYSSEALVVMATERKLQRLKGKYKDFASMLVTWVDKFFHKQSSHASLLETWFYEFLCKQSFMIIIQKSSMTSTVVDLLEKKADEYRIPSCSMSTFLDTPKGIEGTPKYDFKHSVQMDVLASLFLQNRCESPNAYPFQVTDQFVVKKAIGVMIDDDSIDVDSIQVFESIRKLINTFPTLIQANTLISLCLDFGFTDKLLQIASEIFAGIPYTNASHILSYAYGRSSLYKDFIRFLKYVCPKIIRLCVRNKLDTESSDYMMEIVDVLIGQQTELNLEIEFDHFKRKLSKETMSIIDKINQSTLPVTLLIGTMDVLQLLSDHDTNLKSMLVVVYSIEEWRQLSEYLTVNNSFDNVGIAMVYETFPTLENVPSLPMNLIESTEILFYIGEHYNFQDFIKFALQLKCGRALKFKSVKCFVEQYDQNDIVLLSEICLQLSSVCCKESWPSGLIDFIKNFPLISQFRF